MSSLRWFTVVLALCCCMSARAGVIAPGPLWEEFSFIDTSDFAGGCYPNDPNGIDCLPSSSGNSQFLNAAPWTFTTTVSLDLTVTDPFLYGEAFNVYNNCDADLDCDATPILTTPPPVSSRSEEH